MPKFRVSLELDYDVVINVKHKDRPKSKSHLNAIMRDVVNAQVQDALTQYGFTADVYQVRKVSL